MLHNLNSDLTALSLATTQRESLKPANEDVQGEPTEEVASYIFDLLAGARRLAMARNHKFLGYLIGVAAEEARLLTQGRTAAPKIRTGARSAKV